MENSYGLSDLLTLKRVDAFTFIGKNYKTFWKRVYGGQVLAQSLHAANQTVTNGRYVHSLHGYFILAGDIEIPIEFKVENLRDGKSFNTRRVTAFQKGKAIFVLSVSFQIIEKGLSQYEKSPALHNPENLIPDSELLKKTKVIPEQIKKYLLSRHPFAFEFRPEIDYDKSVDYKRTRNIWFKLKNKTKLTRNQQFEFLAYAVDYDLLIMSVISHFHDKYDNPIQTASLDHAMWFHRNFDVNEWLIYSMRSPNISGSRCLGTGYIYDREGLLVATVVQEGLARVLK
jgi:acyl-CoA thioesterase-2